MLVQIVIIVVVFILLLTLSRDAQLAQNIKYELLYQWLGLCNLLEDFCNRQKNVVHLVDCSGRVAIVTGGARGIGQHVVEMLLQCNMHVIVGCRNVIAGEMLAKRLRSKGIQGGQIDCYELDVGSLESVEAFATMVQQHHSVVNVLINNAGIMFPPFAKTKDGFESQWAVNYLGHFLLTQRLLPLLCRGGRDSSGADTLPSRVINVTSVAHQIGEIHLDDITDCRIETYCSGSMYAQSKLAQVLFTLYVQQLLERRRLPVQMHCVHPGLVDTGLFATTPLKRLLPFVPRLLFKRPRQGAYSVVFAAIDNRQLRNCGGTYITNCSVTQPSKQATLASDMQQRLFQFTNKLLHIDDFFGNFSTDN